MRFEKSELVAVPVLLTLYGAACVVCLTAAYVTGGVR